MKTCNNCGTVNDLANEKCGGCNMPGNFTVLGRAHTELTDQAEVKINCSNCGSMHPGNGSNCIHCRFPLSRNKVKKFANQSIQVIRKVG